MRTAGRYGWQLPGCLECFVTATHMMQPTSPDWAVYLCDQPVDFRKGMVSLAVLVEAQLALNPFAEALFVFCNRPCTALKVLYWERNGFCLWQKRLEKQRFVYSTPHISDHSLR